MSLLKAALKYAELGFSVIPVGKDKKPKIKWEPYQKQKADIEQITEWWTKYPDAGVAIVTGAISGICVVDIDTPEGEKEIMSKLGDVVCPTSRTPGGGKHLYFEDIGESNKVGIVPGVDFRGEGGYIIAPPSPGPNGSKSAYAWEPKKKITDLAPAHNLLLRELININSFSMALGASNSVTKEQYCVTKRNIDFSEGHRDETLFHIANVLFKGGSPLEETKQILRVIGLKACEPPFPENEIDTKVLSALERAKRRDRNLTQEVRDILSVTSGNISVTFLAKELQSVTKEERSKLRVVLSRMVEDKILERTGRVAGEFRIIEKIGEEIELDEIEDAEAINVRLPFEMEEFVEIMPKDLIVFAGVPNSGKTALMLETVRLNMDRWKCYYFSTELGRHNAKKRLAKHNECTKWKFKFRDEIPNYYDILKPDDMNFIDYVEVAEGEYYKIPSILSGIQKRLKKGVAFVALQKLPDRGYAVGGGMTLAKPALFCAVDPDYPGAIIRMVKAKNYKDVNPNGYKLKFKIHDGINLESIGIWGPEYE